MKECYQNSVTSRTPSVIKKANIQKKNSWIVNSIVFVHSYAVMFCPRLDNPKFVSRRSAHLGDKIYEKISYFETFSMSYPVLHDPNHLSVQEFPINKFLYI
jgi:hypothetical protein